MSELRSWYPEIEPFDSGMLDVGDGHRVYWERIGTKGAKLSDTKMREYSKASMTSSSPGKPQEQGGALAEALRRAAEKNGRSRA